VSRRYAALNGGALVPAEVVMALAADGDESAQTVLGDAVTALTRTILGAVLLADPQVIVLGGGMAAAGEALTRPLSQALQAALLWREAPPVVVSALGNDAGARGAALLAWTADPGRTVDRPIPS
jgi:glucokinase